MAGDPVGPGGADPAASPRGFAQLIEARAALAVAMIAFLEATHGIDRRVVDDRADELEDAIDELLIVWRSSPLAPR